MSKRLLARWSILSPTRKGLWLTAAGVMVTLIGIAIPHGKDLMNYLNEERPHFSGDSYSVQIFPDDPAKQIKREEFENNDFLTTIYLRNRTSKVLHDVTVKIANQKGLYAVSNGEKTLEVGKFNGTLNLSQTIPPHTDYTVSFWSSGEWEREGHTVVSTLEFGTVNLPYAYSEDCVSVWYKRGFFFLFSAFILRIAWWAYKRTGWKFMPMQMVQHKKK